MDDVINDMLKRIGYTEEDFYHIAYEQAKLETKNMSEKWYQEKVKELIPLIKTILFDSHFR